MHAKVKTLINIYLLINLMDIILMEVKFRSITHNYMIVYNIDGLE